MKKIPHFVRCRVTGEFVHDIRCLLMDCSSEKKQEAVQ